MTQILLHSVIFHGDSSALCAESLLCKQSVKKKGFCSEAIKVAWRERRGIKNR